jgi:hypothetical protein
LGWAHRWVGIHALDIPYEMVERRRDFLVVDRADGSDGLIGQLAQEPKWGAQRLAGEISLKGNSFKR